MADETSPEQAARIRAEIKRWHTEGLRGLPYDPAAISTMLDERLRLLESMKRDEGSTHGR